MPFDLTPLLANVGQNLLSDASYLWVIIFLILTGCGLPIPEEVGIIAAGVWASDGAMNFWLGLAACLFGCIVGDSIMYAIGYRFGKTVLREHPMFAGFLTPERERQIEQMIRRRGAAVLFTARFLVGVRGPVYLTAGILRFPYRRFLLIDLVCATAVVSLFYSLAWYFGQDIISSIRRAEEGITVAVALAIVIGALFFWMHHRRSKRIIATLDRISEGLPASEAMAAFESDGKAPQSGKAEHSTAHTASVNGREHMSAESLESKRRSLN
jgi:membrane protein DedA with SNARE-associated domain